MNKAETRVAKYFEAQGYEVMSTGWPDLMLIRDGQYAGIATVEVKRGGDKVRPNQARMHKALKLAGVPVYIVSPEDLKVDKKYSFKKIVTVEDYKNLREEVHWLKHFATQYEGRICSLVEDYNKIKKEIDRLVTGLEPVGVVLDPMPEKMEEATNVS